MEPNFENIIRTMLSTEINLSQQACVAILSVLWNKEIVCKFIKLILLQEKEEPDVWLNIETYILVCIEKMVLPPNIKLNLKSLVQPTRKQIVNWVSITKRLFQSFPNFRGKVNFVWTGKGTLDHIETAKLIINQNPSNQDLCFSLACLFCIEDAVLKLEPFIYLPFLKSRLKRSGSEMESYLITIWARNVNLRKGLNEPEITFKGSIVDSDELGCLLAQNIMCVHAVMYFLERLSPNKKRVMLLQVLRVIFEHKKPHSGNMLLLLFPYLERYKINHFFQYYAYDILLCFLEWPHQKFFMLVANFTWNYLTQFQYIDLFLEIANRISQFNWSFTYKNIIEEYWGTCPPAFRKHVIQKCMSGTLLNSLFLLRNIDDVILMVLKECTVVEKYEIIFLHESMFICDCLVKQQRWESLQMFVLNCLPTRTMLKSFILKFQKRKSNYYGTETGLHCIFIEKLKCWSIEHYSKLNM